jgi:hypothetical protein
MLFAPYPQKKLVYQVTKQQDIINAHTHCIYTASTLMLLFLVALKMFAFKRVDLYSLFVIHRVLYLSLHLIVYVSVYRCVRIYNTYVHGC